MKICIDGKEYTIESAIEALEKAKAEAEQWSYVWTDEDSCRMRANVDFSKVEFQPTNGDYWERLTDGAAHYAFRTGRQRAVELLRLINEAHEHDQYGAGCSGEKRYPHWDLWEEIVTLASILDAQQKEV